MNILVVGDPPTTHAFYERLAGLPGACVRYCRNESEVISTVGLARRQYAGILLERPVDHLDSVALARTLRAMCPEVPILFVQPFCHDALGASEQPSRVCSIERTADGEYRLHCVWRAAAWPQESEDCSGRSPFDSPYLFEFSAPCKTSR